MLRNQSICSSKVAIIMIKSHIEVARSTYNQHYKEDHHIKFKKVDACVCFLWAQFFSILINVRKIPS